MAVVDHVHRQLVSLFQLLAEVQFFPTEIDRAMDQPFLGVDQAGCADSDAQNGGRAGGDQLVQQVVHQLHRRFAAPLAGGEGGPASDLTLQIDQRAAKLLAAQVHAKQPVGVGVYIEQHGRFAAGRRPQAGLLHQLLL